MNPPRSPFCNQNGESEPGSRNKERNEYSPCQTPLIGKSSTPDATPMATYFLRYTSVWSTEKHVSRLWFEKQPSWKRS